MNQQGEFRKSSSDWEHAQQWEREREIEQYGTVPFLLRQLMSEVTTLFSKEVSLARAEVREAVHGIKTGVVSLLSGGVVLLAGVIILLMAAVYGLATVMALWLAALTVGGAVTLIGFIMVASGKSKLDADALKPHRTIQSIKEERDAARHAIKGEHNELRH